MEILKIHNNPERAEWAALTERFTREEEEITRQVTEILADVKSGGDRSLREVTRRVEGRDPRTFEIPADVRAAAAALIPAALKEALAAAKANIETFHRAQLPPEVDIETMPGVRCVQRAVPIRRVGLYIPGGKAPLFSTVLMLAVPARVAGCGEVILCTPARPDGTIAPEILYAADLCGVDRIFSVGGAQAVGETGLDFVRGADRAAQLSALRTQLRLARERGLPVVLHCVRAFEPLMRELAASEPRAVIFHGFIGSPEQARQALAKGYCLSFGERTFASPKTLAALRGTPLSQLFLETDDSPVPIAEIYARAAEAKGVPEEVLQRAILDNYKRIFTGGEYEGPGRTKGDK